MLKFKYFNWLKMAMQLFQPMKISGSSKLLLNFVQ